MSADDPQPALAPFFLAALAGPAPSDVPPSELEGALVEALRGGRLAWPGLDVPPEAFVAHVAARAAPPYGAASVRALRTADLYLACACLRGDARAIAAFETHYVARLDHTLNRLGAEPGLVEDVKGVVREKLFFPEPGARAALAGYSGRGDLALWLRPIAVTTALKAMRAGKKMAAEEDLLDVAFPGTDPELAHLKATFAAEFKAAFAETAAALSARERNLLRQHALDGLTVDQLGAAYHVHRATAARWVADARERLLQGVRQRLKAKLRLSEADLESVMALARSQLDVSVRRLLRDEGG